MGYLSLLAQRGKAWSIVVGIQCSAPMDCVDLFDDDGPAFQAHSRYFNPESEFARLYKVQSSRRVGLRLG